MYKLTSRKATNVSDIKEHFTKENYDKIYLYNITQLNINNLMLDDIETSYVIRYYGEKKG